MKTMTKRYGVPLLLLILLFTVPVGRAQAQVTVSIPGVVAEIGEEVTIPVEVDGLTGAGVLAYTLDIAYNPDVLEITGSDITKDGTISQDAFISGSVVGGVIYIRAASGSALEGSGTLINIQATVIGEGASQLTFERAEFESGGGDVPSESEDGFVTTSNEAPTADDVAVETEEETPVAVTLSGDDPEGVDVSFEIAAGPQNGTLGDVTEGVDGTATVTYTPDENFEGEDTFTYRVSDGALSSTGTVSITVTPVQDVPEASDDQYEVEEDAELGVDAASGVLANDVDPDEDIIATILDTDVEHGELVLETDGSFTYMPDENFSGMDSFTYFATDGTDVSDPATVTITVTAVNDAPVFTEFLPDTTVAELTTLEFTFAADDIDSDDLTFELVEGPSGAEIDEETGVFTFTPEVGQAGDHDVEIRVSDGEVSATASSVVTVEGLEVTHRAELSARNVIEANASSASGSVAAILEGTTVVFSGSFSGLTSAIQSVDVHVGEMDEEGEEVFSLDVVTEDGHAGAIPADINTYEFDAELVAALEEERLFVIVHTELFPDGEIRGQFRGSDNEAPTASTIVSPADGENVTVGGTIDNPVDGSEPLIEVSWEDATDPDGDQVAYVYEVAVDAEFEAIILASRFPTADGFVLTVADAAEIFDIVTDGSPGNIAVGTTITLYHRVVTTDGSETTVGGDASVSLTRGQIVSTEDPELPTDFSLSGNYPNPFNPTTTIEFDLPTSAHVSVQVIDALGRQVLTTPEQSVAAGEARNIRIDASQLTSGTYLYRVIARFEGREVVQSGTMTLLK